MLVFFIILLFIILPMAGIWKVFSKSGIPGIIAFIPLLNIIFLFKVAKQSMWRSLLLIIPLVNLVIIILLYVDIAKIYGKGLGYALGLTFFPFIFLPLIGFTGEIQMQNGAAAA